MRHFQKRRLGVLLVLSYNVCMYGAWTPPVAISSPCNDSFIARLAFNAGGAGFAVWPQATGLGVNNSPYPIFLSNYNSSTQSWSSLDALTQIGQSNYGNADQAIALDANGNGLVVWARGTAEFTNSNIVAINYVNGAFGPVNNPVVLSQAYSFAPEIGMAPDGDAIVTWVVANIDTYSCYVQAAYYNGTTHDWFRDINGAPLVRTIRDNIQFLDPYLPFSQVAMDSKHRALFIWSELRFDAISGAYTSVVWSCNYDGSGWATWNPPAATQLSVLNGYNPVIAMDEAGDATVVWAGTANTNYVEVPPFAIEAVRYDAATQDYIKNGGSIVIKDLQTNVFPFFFPRVQVAIDPLGNSIITWDNNFTIQVTRYPVTTSWVTWVPSVTQIINNYVLLPTVAMDLNGNATALWMTYVPPYGNLVLQASAYDQATDSWGNPVFVVSDFNHDIDFYATENDWPNVTYDLNGNAYASWAQSDGRVARAYVAQYQPGASVRSVDRFSGEKLDDKTNAARLAHIRSHLAYLREKKGVGRRHTIALTAKEQKK